MTVPVYLVGAGPGDPKLLTLRGRECLSRADVVFYDALANPSLLDHAPADAERVYVGKCAGRHSVPQDQLNDRLVQAARAGKIVVRLKGGDPFLFGRGGEESEALAASGVSFEIVPGVTSAIAGPAYAGIAVTHRDHASSVAFVTGHEDPSKTSPSVDWQRLACSVDTLVVLMGTRRLGEIVSELRAGGRDANTPVAMIEWGTTPRQRTVVSTLEAVVEDARDAAIGSPALVVVGDVVRLRQHLRWFDTKPFFGRRVLVTRARAQASTLSELLSEAGADVVESPTIRCEPPEDAKPLDEAIDQLASFDWVLFASVNAVEFLWERLEAAGRDTRAFAGIRVGVVGHATAEALRQRGISADLIPTESRSEGLLGEIGDVDGLRVLLPRAEEGRDVLRDGLSKVGADVVSVVAYRTVPDAGDADRVCDLLRRGRLDAITLSSASTVSNLMSIVSDAELRQAVSDTCVAVIGPTTRAAAEAQGIRVSVEADEASVESLARAVIAAFTPGGKSRL